MHVRKEALLSAQIEGAQCAFDDTLDPSNEKLLGKDAADVAVYVRATEYAVARMKELPLRMRLLREAHEVLLSGMRGSGRQSGSMRASQNWIDAAGCALPEAAYVPPNVDDVKDALSDLEVFINEEHGTDPMVKAAFVRYQFETIRSFLDGNDRLGRPLITLFPLNDGALSGAVFCPPYEFKETLNSFCPPPRQAPGTGRRRAE